MEKQKTFCDACGKEIQEKQRGSLELGAPKNKNTPGVIRLDQASSKTGKKTYFIIQEKDYCDIECFIADVKKSFSKNTLSHIPRKGG